MGSSLGSAGESNQAIKAGPKQIVRPIGIANRLQNTSAFIKAVIINRPVTVFKMQKSGAARWGLTNAGEIKLHTAEAGFSSCGITWTRRARLAVPG